MSCFLCAYGRNRKPKSPNRGRGVTPPPPPETLGTCWRCQVHACTAHGARAGQFVCAICEGADVVQNTIAPDPDALSITAGGTIPRAAVVGRAASRELLQTVEEALRMIEDTGGGPRPDVGKRLELALPREGEPDLVFNLSEAIRAVADRERARAEEAGEPAVAAEGLEALPEELVDSVGGTVRELFAGREIVLSAAAVQIVTGALVLAVDIADDSDDPYAAALLPPWRMSDPVLLDPVMWMVSTAVNAVTMGMSMGVPAGAR
jgi:hypothetical protein